MTQREWVDDEAKWDSRGPGSLLIDRTRRDLLARIKPGSVESFSYLYGDYEKLRRLEERIRTRRALPELVKGERITDGLVSWLDEILALSQSGGGWRAGQLERVLKSSYARESIDDGEIETEGRGLKHRD